MDDGTIMASYEVACFMFRKLIDLCVRGISGTTL